jgi:hypothetical protein
MAGILKTDTDFFYKFFLAVAPFHECYHDFLAKKL